MITIIKQFLLGPMILDGDKERLDEASKALNKEADKFDSEAKNFSYRKDPIEQVIDNINRVKGKKLNGSGGAH